MSIIISRIFYSLQADAIISLPINEFRIRGGVTVYSDSHAHLVDYEPGRLKEVLELMRTKQVDLALGVEVNLDSSEKYARG